MIKIAAVRLDISKFTLGNLRLTGDGSRFTKLGAVEALIDAQRRSSTSGQCAATP